MKQKPLWGVLLATMLVWSTNVLADDQDVTAWADKVLITTLTVDYKSLSQGG